MTTQHKIVDPDRQSPVGIGRLGNWIRVTVGIDRAIFYSISARAWASIAGIVTLVLIARTLSPAEQGYYFTFNSLVALQIIFELGFSLVILQLASHERAHLRIQGDGSITGDGIAHSRLASVLQKTVRWYAVGALLMAVVLLPAGFVFFLVNRQAGPPVFWQIPWIAVVLATTFTFQTDPIFAFLEGCGRISEVARLRFLQAVVGSLMVWAALALHHGLFAPAMFIFGKAIASGWFLFTQRRLLLPLFRRDPCGHVVSWQREIWPFQWRIAISWVCGYFAYQIFNPVLFAYRGATEAGQMGMSLTICTVLANVAMAWINTKASPFGALIARGEYETLDHLFFRTLYQSALVLAAAAAVLLLGLIGVTQHFPHLAARILPLPIFGILLVTILCNHILASQSVYLRAHKREPFLWVSISIGVLTACSTLLVGRVWGAQGVTIGYFFASGVFGLTYGTFVFVAKRKQWHKASALEETNKQGLI